ncbi:phosphatase PAP2 family protein [Sphingomonas sp.]|uniref:phosphatase PAP2 family protein n=1 Tax=Sphingomonas sp. TaxID=28214 RepID=UPI00286E21B5|nr:phosphatase PAP2 family protein [Sphingomonas sp.]
MIRKLSPARLGAVIAILAAVWLAMLVTGAGPVDRGVLLALYAGDEPWLALGAIGVSYLGTWPTVVAVTLAGAAWLLYRGKRGAALLLIIASFTGRAMVILEKAYFARLRPDEHLRMVEVHYQSFPSGHSANSMIVYLGLALLAVDDPRHRQWAVGAALALTFLIGLSRPMLGVHWPSDVVAGWSFGALWLLAVLAAADKWRPGLATQTLKRNSSTSPS